MTTQELEKQFTDAQTRVNALISRASDPMSPTEKTFIQTAIDQANTIKDRLRQARGDASMTAEINRLTEGMTSTPSHVRGRSLGQQIMQSEMGQWLLTNKGKFPAGMWTSLSSELPMMVTLTEDAASGGDLVVADVQRGILPLPQRPLVVADLIAPGTTDSNMVTYMKEITFTNTAATVVEGAAKPESTLVFDAVSDPVRKIAHWIPVTEEMLEDVPALQSYIDARLRLGVQLKEDDQLLNGSVVPPDVIGFLARTGLAASIARGADTNADVILAQIAAIETATGLRVDGIVLNPSNWKTILLAKDGNGNYIGGGGPFQAAQRPMLWGRNVALTSAIVANTALVGAFKTASQLFRKGNLRVEASNSHSDFFIKNLIAIRAEERLALAVYRASAFGTVTNLN